MKQKKLKFCMIFSLLVSLVLIPNVTTALFGVLMNRLQVDVPGFIDKTVSYGANSLIAIALITLGIQLGNNPFKRINWPVASSMVCRLLLGPFIAFLMIKVMGIEGMVASVFLLTASMPSSVNSAIIAAEKNQEPETASQMPLNDIFFAALPQRLLK